MSKTKIFGSYRILPLALSLIVVGGGVADAATFLSTTATGDESGSSWANACTTVAGAFAAAASGDGIIYAAEGVYTISAPIMVSSATKLFGGFEGTEDEATISPADRAPRSEHQTIFTGDINGNDIWEHREPNIPAGTQDIVNDEQNGTPIIVGGKVNIPTPTGDFDWFWPKKTSNEMSDNCPALLTFADTLTSGTECVVDGVWFLGGVGTYGAYQPFFSSGEYGAAVTTKGKIPAVVTNCTFIANFANVGTLFACGNAKTFVRDCDFLFNRGTSNNRGLAICSRGKLDVEDVRVIGCARDNANGGGVFNLWSGSGFTFTNVVVTRASGRGSNDAYNGAGVILGIEAGGAPVDFFNCVFTNNTALNAGPFGSLFAGGTFIRFRGCLFENNHVGASVGDANSGLGLFHASGQSSWTFDGCAILRNSLKVISCTISTIGEYVASIVTSSRNAAHSCAIINTLFADNEVSVAPGAVRAGVTPRLSRAVAFDGLSGITPNLGIAHSVFSGTSELPDVIVYADSSQTSPINVVNCVFERDGALPSGGGNLIEPFEANIPSLLKVINCTATGYYYPLEGATFVGLESDSPLLQPLEVPADSPIIAPVRALGAKTPGIRESADVVQCDLQQSGSMPHYKYSIDGRQIWHALVPGRNNGNAATAAPLPDALGKPRTFGEYTRGALQALGNGAETGYTVVARAFPAPGAAIFTPAVQVVQDAAEGASVSAAGVTEGAEISAWYASADAAGTPLATGATLTLAPLAAETTVVYASLETPSVSITFDLGAAGTFGNGLSTTNFSAAAGTTLTIPAFTPAADFLLEEWLGGLGDTVPWEDAVYMAKTVSTAVRVFCIVPEGEECGAADGSSWENATSDYTTAMLDAARYRGELWFKKGIYTVTETCNLRSNVSILGGFAGTETSASEANPAANPTIFNGDKNKDDYYRPCDSTSPQNVNKGAVWNWTSVPPTFNRPNTARENLFWETAAKVGDSSEAIQLFASSCATNCVISGVTITGFRKYALLFQNNSQVSLTNCKIYANNTGRNGEGAVFYKKSFGTISDCEFVANYRALSLYDEQSTASPERLSTIRNCVFEDNYSWFYAASISATYNIQYGYYLIEGCTFANNGAINSNGNATPGVAAGSRSNRAVTIRDCDFINNRLKNAFGSLNLNFNNPEVINCRFRGNTLATTTSGANAYAAAICVSDSSPFVRDCYIAENTVTGDFTADNTANVAYGIIAQKGGSRSTIFNCTIENNSVDVTLAAGVTLKKTVFGTYVINDGGGNVYSALVHCLFSNNSLSEAARAEIVGNAGAFGNFAIFNTILRNDAAGEAYKPIDYLQAAFHLSTASCILQNFDPEAWPIVVTPGGSYGFRWNTYSEAADISPTLAVNSDGAIARSLAAWETRKKIGRPIWRGTDGLLYFYDDTDTPPNIYGGDKRWRPVLTRSAADADSATKNAATLGLALDAPPIADAFGAPRIPGKIAPGPLNTISGATRIFMQ